MKLEQLFAERADAFEAPPFEQFECNRRTRRFTASAQPVVSLDAPAPRRRQRPGRKVRPVRWLLAAIALSALGLAVIGTVPKPPPAASLPIAPVVVRATSEVSVISGRDHGECCGEHDECNSTVWEDNDKTCNQ